MDNTTKTFNIVVEYCKNHGTLLTEKRKYILKALIESDKALSAYELVDFIKEKYQQYIPVMSIYRILTFLEKKHLIYKFNISARYISLNCSHFLNSTQCNCQFIICNKCNKVEKINFQEKFMKNINSSVKEVNFKLIRSQIEMVCLCNNCLQEPEIT
tara:strand:- start:3618 stop:4088 length:471 start_codon:yes stop_codon:yes gene_type:complete